MERDSIAVLPITSYSHWWEKQIDSSVSNKVRKVQKKGVVIRLTDFNDELVQGITEIFNQIPIWQGRRFLHYGKSFDTIKRQLSRFCFEKKSWAPTSVTSSSDLLCWPMLENTVF
jgi:hypothetical protein